MYKKCNWINSASERLILIYVVLMRYMNCSTLNIAHAAIYNYRKSVSKGYSSVFKSAVSMI